jgi:hypothetical protein
MVDTKEVSIQLHPGMDDKQREEFRSFFGKYAQLDVAEGSLEINDSYHFTSFDERTPIELIDAVHLLSTELQREDCILSSLVIRGRLSLTLELWMTLAASIINNTTLTSLQLRDIKFMGSDHMNIGRQFLSTAEEYFFEGMMHLLSTNTYFPLVNSRLNYPSHILQNASLQTLSMFITKYRSLPINEIEFHTFQFADKSENAAECHQNAARTSEDAVTEETIRTLIASMKHCTSLQSVVFHSMSFHDNITIQHTKHNTTTSTTTDTTTASDTIDSCPSILSAFFHHPTLSTVRFTSTNHEASHSQSLTRTVTQLLTTCPCLYSFEYHPVDHEEAMILIREGLVINETIQHLRLRTSHTSRTVIDRLACLLARTNCSYRTLDISGSVLKVDGAKALAQALQRNQSLEKLILARTYLGYNDYWYGERRATCASSFYHFFASMWMYDQSGIKAIASAIRRHPKLTSVDFSHTGVRSEGLQAIMQACRLNRLLQEVILLENDITARDCHALVQMMERNTTIVHLTISPLVARYPPVDFEQYNQQILQKTMRNKQKVELKEQ